MTWRERVLLRDGDCGLCRCANADEAHHIYPKAKWPELRNKVANGIGLCSKCHKAIYGKEEQFIEQLLEGRKEQARKLGAALRYIVAARDIKLGVKLR